MKDELPHVCASWQVLAWERERDRVSWEVGKTWGGMTKDQEPSAEGFIAMGP
jgi:hypothetical protein